MIPINDLKRHNAEIGPVLSEAVDRVVSSGWYLLGEECAAFENKFASYCGVEHAVGVGNGTDALEISLRALGISETSRVATVANAGYYSSTAISAIGAEPVYIDVDRHDHLMNLDLLESELASGTIDAIIVTHLYGLMHDVEKVMAIARPAGARVLEDCAQAHGAVLNGNRAGSVGDAAAFSFFPTKNLGAIGDGGAVVSSDPLVAERTRHLRQYGWERKYHVCERGGRNSRLDEIQAAVLNCKLDLLDKWNSRRRRIAKIYSEGIEHENVVTPPLRGDEWTAHLYVVKCADRERLADHLRQSGIATDIHYPVPDHLQVVCENSKPSHDLPVTEELAGLVLTLPCFPEMTDAEIRRVVDTVNGHS